MVTKSELFEQYNNRIHTTERGFNIVCILKQSWSLSKMQEAIKEWEDVIAHHKAFQNWSAKLFAHAASLGYSENEVLSHSWATTREAFKHSKRLEDDINRMTERLLKHPNNRQYEVIKKLSSTDDRHIRLYGDGFTAVSSGTGNWYRIGLDGQYQSILECPIQETELYWQYTFVKISDDLGVRVNAETDGLKVSVFFNMQYKDPYWYDINISDGINLNKAINMGSFSTTPEVALLAADGLKLASAIAQDLENFVNNPHEWIQKQCKLPRPFDAVLSR
jgi:hypothetical protein